MLKHQCNRLDTIFGCAYNVYMTKPTNSPNNSPNNVSSDVPSEQTNAMPDQQNFAALSAEMVLDALASVGIEEDGRLLVLNSYENRVYQVGRNEAEPVVVKFYRPHRWSDAAILEEHAFVHELMQQEIPVVAPLAFHGETLLHYQGFRFAVFPRQGGRAPDIERSDTLEWMGRLMGRIHAIGALKSYTTRPSLDAQSFGVTPRTWLLEHNFIPAELEQTWESVSAQALEAVQACYARAGEIATLRLHGDCHSGNVLWTDAGPHFVDFDDSRTGPAIQDLWMLLSGERGDRTRQLSDLLAGYEDFFEFDPRQLHIIEALRTLRLLHYSYWIAMRWDDPAFQLAFPWFNTMHYWQDRILELREQIAAMDEAPLRLF